MTTWVALLRGVNVGGHNKLPMAEFRGLLADLGFGDPRTYIQSGNAVFESADAADQISGDIAAGIKKLFGFEPKVMVVDAENLDAAIAANPIPQAADEPNQLHLFFTSETFADLDLAALQNRATNGEELRLVNDVLYFHTPNGFGKSALAGKLVSLAKIPMTGRNLRSCAKIAELAGKT